MQPILRIRELLKLSQKEMAASLGVGQSCVSQYERGAIVMSPTVAMRLVQVAAERGQAVTLDQVYGLAEVPAAEPAIASAA